MQTVAPQVRRVLNDVVNSTGSQNAAGTNSNKNAATNRTSIQMQDRRNENSKNMSNGYLHSYKILLHIAAMLRLPYLQEMAIPRKVLLITTNPKQIQPSQMNLSNKPKKQ